MVRLVIHTIRAVLQGYHWGPAFASNGLTGNQDTVSMYIKGELEYERLPLYPPLCLPSKCCAYVGHAIGW